MFQGLYRVCRINYKCFFSASRAYLAGCNSQSSLPPSHAAVIELIGNTKRPCWSMPLNTCCSLSLTYAPPSLPTFFLTQLIAILLLKLSSHGTSFDKTSLFSSPTSSSGILLFFLWSLKKKHLTAIITTRGNFLVG